MPTPGERNRSGPHTPTKKQHDPTVSPPGSTHNISIPSISKSVFLTDGIFWDTYIATPPPCQFLFFIYRLYSLIFTFELSIVLSNLVSLAHIMSKQRSIVNICSMKSKRFTASRLLTFMWHIEILGIGPGFGWISPHMIRRRKTPSIKRQDVLLKYRQPRTMLEYDFDFHNPTIARHWSIPITVVY